MKEGRMEKSGLEEGCREGSETGTYCKKRFVDRLKARYKKIKWPLRIVLGIMLLWVVSRGFFCLQTYLALNELNRNSNLEYKLGEQLPDEELERYFKIIGSHHAPAGHYYYRMIEPKGRVSGAKYFRYPSTWRFKFPFRLTYVESSNPDFEVLGIKNGTRMREVGTILSKRFYKEIRNDTGDEEQNRYFYKGGVGIYIWQDKGKVCGITLRLKSYKEYRKSKIGETWN